MKNIKIEFTNERIIPASGLAVVGAILGKKYRNVVQIVGYIKYLSLNDK